METLVFAYGLYPLLENMMACCCLARNRDKLFVAYLSSSFGTCDFDNANGCSGLVPIHFFCVLVFVTFIISVFDILISIPTWTYLKPMLVSYSVSL